MFWQGFALGILIGYTIKKLLSGEYNYETDAIYQKGFENGYADGYRDCQIENW